VRSTGDVSRDRYVADVFTQLNRALAAAGLPEHHEPWLEDEGDAFTLQMLGYGGLHALRRLAAHLQAGREPGPFPPGSDPSKDRVLRDLYEQCDWKVGSNGTRRFRSRGPLPGFDHLVFHSDADGMYVPTPFDDVILAWEEGQVYTAAIGSSLALLAECERLARWLGVPLDIHPDSDLLWAAADSPPTSGEKWKTFGVESFGCLRLFAACNESVNQGRALLFS
jgi:hypothetical protein